LFYLYYHFNIIIYRVEKLLLICVLVIFTILNYSFKERISEVIIPILEPAKGVYLEAIKKYNRFRQVPLMSADYEVNGEIYKFVGF